MNVLVGNPHCPPGLEYLTAMDELLVFPKVCQLLLKTKLCET